MAEGKVSNAVLKKRKKLRNVRNAEKKRMVNAMRRSRMKTYTSKLEQAIADKKPKEDILKSFAELQKELMRGASKHIIHKNTSYRKIARMCTKVKKAIGEMLNK